MRTAVLGGTAPDQVKVPMDVGTCKENLLRWLSATVDELNTRKDRVAHCWKTTRLLRAWEGEVQLEAAGRVSELFPNLDPADACATSAVAGRLCEVFDDATEEDEQACYAGAAFVTQEREDEWEGFVDWSHEMCLLWMRPGRVPVCECTVYCI